MLQANKNLILREAEELWNTNDIDIADELFAPDFIGHFGAEPVRGPAGMKSVLTTFIEAFPDIRMNVVDIFGEGDKVVSRWRAKGTHKGEFMGIRPSGKQVTIKGITIWQVANGKIVVAWPEVDVSDVMG